MLQDQATEVILTLGQAFEVAYQMALRDQFAGSRGGNGISSGGCHIRSLSATHTLAPSNAAPHPWTSSSSHSNHFRSLSVNEIKVNGQGETEGGSSTPLGASGHREDRDGSTAPASTDESADVVADAARGSEVALAPIALTEQL
jgi:hypothetical protein